MSIERFKSIIERNSDNIVFFGGEQVFHRSSLPTGKPASFKTSTNRSPTGDVSPLLWNTLRLFPISPRKNDPWGAKPILHHALAKLEKGSSGRHYTKYRWPSPSRRRIKMSWNYMVTATCRNYWWDVRDVDLDYILNRPRTSVPRWRYHTAVS